MLKKLMTMMATVMLAVVAIAAQCTATTRKGTQCRRQASPGSSYCWQHGGTTKAERAAGSLLNDASTRQSENSYQQCKVTTKRGTQCSRRAKAGSSYCWQHYAISDDTRDMSQTMLESFYMSNMSPQNPSFNRGVWARLEQVVRRFAYDEGCIFIVTGPIFTEDDTDSIGANKVRVPGFYYKVIYDETPPEKMIAFIIPNKGSKKALDNFVVTVDDVEEATGLDFFSELPLDVQQKLESKSCPDDWTWRDSRRGARDT